MSSPSTTQGSGAPLVSITTTTDQRAGTDRIGSVSAWQA